MRLVLAFILALLPALAWAQAPAEQPLVRTKVVPDHGAIIGQPVRLDVDVLFPGEMVRPPLVSFPEAPGAQIFRFETQALTTRDTIDGRDYVGQTFEFVLFPRRGGTIDIPAAKVTLLDRSGGSIGTAQGSPSQIAVSVPPGVDASGPVLVSDQVEVRQEWSPDPAAAKLVPGSAIVRTIHRSADGVPALGMAEFTFEAPEGVRVYADPPVTEDRSNRGQVTGARTDKITYVFEKAGSYELPALSQPWWSLANKQARTETLPGVTVTVAAAPSTPGRSRLQPAWIVGALLGLGALVLAAFGGRLLARNLQSRRERYRASSAFARRELLKAARTGDPQTAYRALTAWRQRLTPAERAAIDRDPALVAAGSRLGQALFGGEGTWDRTAAAALAQAVAASLNAAGKRPEAEPLPPLNPTARAAVP